MRVTRRVAIVLAGAAALVSSPMLASAASAADEQPSVIVGEDGAHLRNCPGPRVYGDPACSPFELLPTGSHVLMRCWSEGTAPADGASRKWFWVKELDDAPRPGLEGYVWSDLVGDQTDVPECDGSQFAYNTGPQVTLAAGPAAPSGLRYAITLTAFPAGSTVTVACYDSVDASEPFYEFPVTVDDAGNAGVENECYSGDGPDHWVTANGIESAHVPW